VRHEGPPRARRFGRHAAERATALADKAKERIDA
jgi:hypothetical protein